MSSFVTSAPFAMLDTRNGLALETFATFADLAGYAVYAHAIGHLDKLSWPEGMTEAQRCDQLLARIDVLAEETRQAVIRRYDPARLRPEQEPLRSPYMLATDKLQEALRDLEALGFVVTVEQRPKQPLAMGNYQTVISTRKARGAS